MSNEPRTLDVLLSLLYENLAKLHGPSQRWKNWPDDNKQSRQYEIGSLLREARAQIPKNLDWSIWLHNKLNMDAKRARDYMTAEKRDQTREAERRAKYKNYEFDSFGDSKWSELFNTLNRKQQIAALLRKVGYKKAAQQLHPDKGGTHDDMVILNQLQARSKQPGWDGVHQGNEEAK